jgi:gliding motility-associated-like protein
LEFRDGSPLNNQVSPSHQFPSEAGIYLITLIAINDAGCRDTTSKVIRIDEELIFYVPNAFTPDNDDFNEVFKPVFTQGFDPLNYHLMIFNRWGEVLFESYDSEVGWNGTYGIGSTDIVQDGVYIWKITFKRTGVDDRESHTGHVTLIR